MPDLDPIKWWAMAQTHICQYCSRELHEKGYVAHQNSCRAKFEVVKQNLEYETLLVAQLREEVAVDRYHKIYLYQI